MIFAILTIAGGCSSNSKRIKQDLPSTYTGTIFGFNTGMSRSVKIVLSSVEVNDDGVVVATGKGSFADEDEYFDVDVAIDPESMLATMKFEYSGGLILEAEHAKLSDNLETISGQLVNNKYEVKNVWELELNAAVDE